MTTSHSNFSNLTLPLLPSPPTLKSGDRFHVAEVLIQLETKALDGKTFSYLIPESLQQNVKVGCAVLVSFGRQTQQIGLVVSIYQPTKPNTFTLKPIDAVLSPEPLFDEDTLSIFQWIAKETATPLAQVMNTALPSAVLHKLKPTAQLNSSVTEDSLSTLLLTPYANQVFQVLKAQPKKAYTLEYLGQQLKPLPKPQRKHVLQAAIQELTASHLITLSNGLPTIEAKLQKQIEKQAKPKKAPKKGKDTPSEERPPEKITAPTQALSPHQQTVLDQLHQTTQKRKWLLHGVTGSGKTEIYMALAEETLANDQYVLILLPEIALSGQIAKRFIKRFGQDVVALWHSQMTEAQRLQEWHAIRSGTKKLIVGARSAIFAPIPNLNQTLGLMVIDECHDPSLKQDSPAPRYDVRRVAEYILENNTKTNLILGSATPSVAQYETAKTNHHCISLTKRYGLHDLATVKIIDLKKESRAGRLKGVLSQTLKDAIAETLAREEQVIILKNRRGYHTLVRCVACEHTFECPHCSVSLTLHESTHQLRCHYCGYYQGKPEYCPACASCSLKFLGTGSQRVEQELHELFPEAKIIRMDSDTAQKKATHAEMEGFIAGNANILVGTQMVAKGFDIPNVTLVGVIGADAYFLMPDFGAAERGFQLLTQVAGRSGRGGKPGFVYVQTWQPDHPVLQMACDQDYLSFYEYEITQRALQQLPPYSDLIRFGIRSPFEPLAMAFAKGFADTLTHTIQTAGLKDQMTLLGPSACLIPKIQAQFRYHLLIKNQAGEAGQHLLAEQFKAAKPPTDCQFIFDPHPTTLL